MFGNFGCYHVSQSPTWVLPYFAFCFNVICSVKTAAYGAKREAAVRPAYGAKREAGAKRAFEWREV